MSIRKDILNLLKYGFITVMLLGVIGFTNTRQSDKYIEDVIIDIDNQFENYFIDEDDVLDLINEEGKDYLLGSDFGSLKLKELEARILKHKFIGGVQVYRDLTGTLTIEVEQNRPIARILNPNGDDTYISTTGELLPESAHYTARVMLIAMEAGVDSIQTNIRDTPEGSRVFDLISYIDEHSFWKAQIAGLQVDRDYEIKLMPQVTKQIIEFGQAEQIEEKFKKLSIFYKRILPYEGWNSYETVNLKYEKQIVCK